MQCHTCSNRSPDTLASLIGVKGDEGGSLEHIFIGFFGALAQVNSKVSWMVVQRWAPSLVTVAFTLLTLRRRIPPHTLKHDGVNRIPNRHSCNYQPGQPLASPLLLLIPPSHSLSFLLSVKISVLSTASFCSSGLPWYPIMLAAVFSTVRMEVGHYREETRVPDQREGLHDLSYVMPSIALPGCMSPFA